ncbi:RimK family protein [Reichenbachiella carrageenanivorans]|uniref:RimK family protein n=1 Tax=Reichenbachiella carrageenanivorans TaxID=2979869 RepID=A0ABY6CUT1_9BACT|nr:RimK family protein [Reichenbachiella carrageenanivorans]UXX77680.1 RimK family protein [Reichenbachiella carrageenanivorans]
MSKLIITENPEKWSLSFEGVTVVTPTTYFGNPEYQAKKFKIINLCKSHQYQSVGYYVSLLAEARGHKVIPEIATLQDFRFPSLIKDDADDFEDLINESLKGINETKFTMKTFLGYADDPAFSNLGALIFNLFQVPIIQAVFEKKEKWQLKSLKTLHLNEVAEEEFPMLQKALHFYLMGKNVVRKKYARKKYDLAILLSPDDPTPPSCPKAIQKFISEAEKKGFNVEIITKNDFGKLVQFDALLIRVTTNVNHYTYRFAKKAESEGLVVFDDPNSILKCTNKVYLHELLVANKIKVPKSHILRKDHQEIPSEFNYPLVIKQPDGSFSKGVKKIANAEELKPALKELFSKSELLILQEFVPTAYDWRVGIIDGQPLYVCKYYMAQNHWQIVDWKKNGEHREGKSETLKVEDAPKKLIETALKATSLIGKGLYGVDIKEIEGVFYVIEVNDNPSIDVGVEDKVLKNQLYAKIMDTFLQRLN